MAILVGKETTVVIQGITGREASMVAKLMLDYGTSVAAGVTPGRGGQNVEGVPVYDTLKAARQEHKLNTSIIYVPPAAVLNAVWEAVANDLQLILIVTENIPQLDAIKILQLAKNHDVQVVGPNSVGIISPAQRCKLGAIGGDNTERCFVPGRIGVISRSGGMTAECSWMVKRAGYGVSTSVSIGGDALIGTPPQALLPLFEEDEETEAVLLFSEPGTNFEEEVADSLEQRKFTKPLIAYVAGSFTEDMPEGTVFGHAAAIIERDVGRPSTKIERLAKAGAYVAEQFDDIIGLLRRVIG
ncbi:CoA-binding protein [Candidatus Bipolaricaulota bacterium]|nr:CoA-binding protein [Candidatus Bipolaricaulota bacterium]HBR10017.1 succinate--CoA ligase subunit alpha [Candidatus Acetothermia bacterium]